MRRFLVATATFALLLAAGHPALADGVPSPSNSTIPAFIILVGADVFGHPDPAGTFSVVFRDLANNPVPGVHIVVDFTGANDLRLCGAQGASVSIVAGGVMGVTDLNGTVTMTLLGHAIPNASPSPPWAVKFWADGVLLGSVPGAAFDLDGVNGVSGADLSRWLGDFVSGVNMPRADYDGTGALGGNDLKLWLQVFTRGTSSQSCPTVVTAPN